MLTNYLRFLLKILFNLAKEYIAIIPVMCYIIGGNGCFEMEGQKGRFSCNQTNFSEQVERRGTGII